MTPSRVLEIVMSDDAGAIFWWMKSRSGGTLGGAAMAPPAPAAAPEPRGEFSDFHRYFAEGRQERHYGSVMVERRSGRAVSERLMDFRLGRIRSRLADHPILGSRMWE